MEETTADELVTHGCSHKPVLLFRKRRARAGDQSHKREGNGIVLFCFIYMKRK